MFEVKPSNLPGCYELQPIIFNDERGKFVKVFHDQDFAELGLETAFTEEYYSTSKKNVIRGMHFQLPPMDHVKFVYCIVGEVMDVVIDLRVGSPTFGHYAVFELSAEKSNCVYIPKGMAHGFYVQSEQAIMVYKCSSVYSTAHDAGVLWNSVGIPWPTSEVILSARDKSFPKFERFISPFSFLQN